MMIILKTCRVDTVSQKGSRFFGSIEFDELLSGHKKRSHIFRLFLGSQFRQQLQAFFVFFLFAIGFENSLRTRKTSAPSSVPKLFVKSDGSMVQKPLQWRKMWQNWALKSFLLETFRTPFTSFHNTIEAAPQKNWLGNQSSANEILPTG